MILSTNPAWFLCITQPEGNKIYTINAWWEQWNFADHTVIVSHKWVIKEISWKDLWNTMQLIRITQNNIKTINESNDMSEWFTKTVRSILSWYTGYDEYSNINYHYVPKLNGEKLVERLNLLDFFCDQYDIKIIESRKWWMEVWSSIEITEDERKKYILAQFLGLCCIYGKPTLNKNILNSYKIQVPILHYEIVENIEKIISLLREYHFVLNATYNSAQQVYEITTSDYDLLAYILILYWEEMNASLIDKILDLQKEIFIQYGISASQKNMKWKIYEVRR